LKGEGEALPVERFSLTVGKHALAAYRIAAHAASNASASNASAARGSIVWIHGLGEYALRYEPVMQWLAEQGWSTLSFDFYGHGHSPGQRGGARTYQQLLDAISAAVEVATNAFGQNDRLKPIVFGHSMGGNAVANHAIRHGQSIRGIVLSAPMFLPKHRTPNRQQLFAAKWTGRLIPWWRISAKIQPAQLTSSTTQQEVDQRDPLLHGKLTLRFATELLEHGRWALDHASELRVPALILHGTSDPLVDVESSIGFASRAGKQCAVVTFEGLQHETLRESNPAPRAAMLHWLEEKFGPPASVAK
jgi:alpha-beta hydrolase superfamily lysophospholipase